MSVIDHVQGNPIQNSIPPKIKYMKIHTLINFDSILLSKIM